MTNEPSSGAAPVACGKRIEFTGNACELPSGHEPPCMGVTQYAPAKAGLRETLADWKCPNCYYKLGEPISGYWANSCTCIPLRAALAREQAKGEALAPMARLRAAAREVIRHAYMEPLSAQYIVDTLRAALGDEQRAEGEHWNY